MRCSTVTSGSVCSPAIAHATVQPELSKCQLRQMLQRILNCSSANSMVFLFSATTDTAVHPELSKSQVHDLPFSRHSRQSSISWTVQAPNPWSSPFQPQQTKQNTLNSPSIKSTVFPFPAIADKAEHPEQSKHRPSPWSSPLQPQQTKQYILNSPSIKSTVFPFTATAIHPEQSKRQVRDLPKMKDASYSVSVICFVRGCWQLLRLPKMPTTKKVPMSSKRLPNVYG